MEKISARIERFIRTGEGDFESLACVLYAWQFARNTPYRAFCEAQGAGATISSWDKIPAVPIRAFKSAELATFPTGRAAAIFESSGTTTPNPSRHYLKDLIYYETAASISFKRWVLPDEAKLPFLILTPPPAEAPRSSLTWMFDTVQRRFSAGGDYFVQRGRIDELRLTRALQQHIEKQQPVILLGTTLAFLGYFNYCESQGITFRLPMGSRLLDTGGMKGTHLKVTRPEFVRSVSRVFAIPEDHCINEYGMCELSSQFYGRGTSVFLQGPPWVRTRLVGGCLQHFDLANVDSVIAIQTEDIGELHPDGFSLFGRSPESEPKGCSLTMDHIS